MVDDSILNRLYDLLKEAAEATDATVDEPMSPDLFLPDILDSIGLTTLLTLIEDEWDVVFEDFELGPEMFESPQTLVEAIRRKLGLAEPA